MEKKFPGLSTGDEGRIGEPTLKKTPVFKPLGGGWDLPTWHKNSTTTLNKKPPVEMHWTGR